MNKKFSTLVAGLLLATTVGTVSAVTVDKGVNSGYPRTVAKAIDGKFYQLSNGYEVLVMEKTTNGTYVLKFVAYDKAELAKTLWEIKATDSKDEKGLAFQFYNVSTGLPISVDVSKANKVGSASTVAEMAKGTSSWSWMRGVEGDPLLNPSSIEAFFGEKRDSVVALVNTVAGVAAQKYATKDMASISTGLKLKPMEASPVYLNAYDLNTMLQTGKSNLHLIFNPDVSTDAKVNEFTGADGKREYTVTDAIAQNSLSIGSVADAQADVNAKKIEKDRLGQELTEAVEAFISLDGTSQQLLIDLEEATKIYTDGRTLIRTQRGIYNENKKLSAQYADEKMQHIAEYEGALLLSEADRKDWDIARIARLKALGKYQDAEDAKDIAEGELERLGGELGEAQTALETAEGVKAKAYDNKRYINAVLAAAQKLDITGAVYAKAETGTLYSNTSYKRLLENDPVAAEALVYYFATTLKSATLNVTITDDVKKAYLADYDKAYTAAVAAQKDAKAAEVAAEAAYDTYQDGEYATAIATFGKTKKAYESKDKVYQEVLGRWQDSSTEANVIWAKVEVAQANVEDALAKMDEAHGIIVKETATIAAKKARVSELRIEYITAKTEYIAAKRKVTKANKAYLLADGLWNNAEAYLASIKHKAEDWYSLKNADDSFLMVDTAYIEGYAHGKNQTFKLNKFEAAAAKYPGIEKMTARDIDGRFNFRFLYYPTIDSLVITADGGNDKPVNNKNWSDYRPIYDMTSRNYVKLAVLGNGANEHREVTLGAPYNIYTGFAAQQQTLNTRISLGLVKNTPVIDMPAGLYFVDIVNTTDAQKNGARLMADLDGTLTKVTPAEWDVMNFQHMPAAKWVVTGTTLFGGSPEIINQETKDVLNGGNYTVEKVENGVVTLTLSYYNYQDGRYDETVKLTPAEANAYGYYHTDPANKFYTLNYLNVNSDLAVTVGNSAVGKDTLLRVAANDPTKFDLVMVGKVQTYGEADTLQRAQYLIRVNDPNKFANNNKYVQITNVDGTEMLVVSDKVNATAFHLKEVNEANDIHYYALIANGKKAGVIDASGLMKAEDIKAETTTSAFALNPVDVQLYREFTTDELGETGAISFYRVNSTEKAYLYEGADNLLCVEGKGDNKAEAFTVIPTGVKETIMPQYLIAKDVEAVKGDTIWCNATAGHSHATLADSLACSHTVITSDTTFGRFLVNMVDSVKAGVDKYTWEAKYKRLAFLPGYFTADTLVLEGTTKNVALSTENKHDAAKFAFRLVNDETNDFLIESESWKNGNEFAGAIAPSAILGGWVKVQNGVPVIINDFEAAMQSDLFNVDTNKDAPTSNDEVTASEITVIAGEGQVTIAGATGKKVVINNILGQVVANTVITSDNVTIAAPAGVVVVAVEGEAAVKAIVK